MTPTIRGGLPLSSMPFNEEVTPNKANHEKLHGAILSSDMQAYTQYNLERQSEADFSSPITMRKRQF
jgi:hypothetical protein